MNEEADQQNVQLQILPQIHESWMNTNARKRNTQMIFLCHPWGKDYNCSGIQNKDNKASRVQTLQISHFLWPCLMHHCCVCPDQWHARSWLGQVWSSTVLQTNLGCLNIIAVANIQYTMKLVSMQCRNKPKQMARLFGLANSIQHTG